MNQQARDKLMVARFSLLRSGNGNDAYYGHILLHLKMAEDTTLGQCMGWTDGITLGYNPERILGSTIDQIKGFLVHEADHIQGLHCLRMAGKDHHTWNVATDYVINGNQAKYGRTLYEGALIDQQYDGKTAETVYAELNAKRQNQEQQQNDQQQADDGDQQDDQQADGQDDGQPGDQDDDQSGQPDDQPGDQPGDQAGNGQPGDDGQPDDQPGDGQGQGAGQPDDSASHGEIRPYPGADGGQPSDSEIRQAEAEMKHVMSQARAAAHKAGDMSADLEREIERTIEPPMSVSEYLRQYLDQYARDDYSWSRPSARYTAQGLYLPGLKSASMNSVVFVLDTSGTMWHGPELEEAQAVLEDAMTQFKCKLTLIHADRAIKHVEELTQADLPLALRPRGGGGTDFRPAFDYVEAEGLDPRCLIYFTDCDGAYPDQEPDYPVLWCKIRDLADPPWGDVLDMPR